MAAAITLGVILTAYDKMTKPINDAVKKAQEKLDAFGKSSKAAAENWYHSGKELTAAGLAVGAPLYKAISSYAELEDAQLSLKSTMMDSAGKVAPVFDQINKTAIDLGNQLPGTTKDFYEMFDTMIRNGADANDIVNGVGKSAAYLGVQLKIPYTEAGELATRLKVATGVANEDMMKFMDTLSRVNEVGVHVDEMRYAFQRSAGELKAMNIQGINDTQKLGTVFAMLIKTMGSGEKVGTGFSSLLSSFSNPKAMKKMQDAAKGLVKGGLHFTDAETGDFLGLDNMMEQIYKLKDLTTAQREAILAPLGRGPRKQIIDILISEGKKGYDDLNGVIKKNADLNTKVNSQLGSLKNMWEAVTGSMENTAATLGSTLAPGLKRLFDKLNNKYLPLLTNFIEKHPVLVKRLMYAAIAFTALAFAGAYLSFALSGLNRLFSLGSFFLKRLLNPVETLTMGKRRLFRAVIRAKHGFEKLKDASEKVWAGLKKVGSVIGETLEKNWKALTKYVRGTAIPWLTKYSKALYSNVVSGLKGAGKSVISFGNTLLGSPITWYVAAAVALGVAAYFIYKKWDKIAAFFKGLWNGPLNKKWVQGLLIAIAPIIGIPILIIKNWSKIAAFFKNLLHKLTDWFKNSWLGKGIMKLFGGGNEENKKAPVKAIAATTKEMRDHLPSSPSKKGAFRDLNKVNPFGTLVDNMRKSAPLLLNTMQSLTGSAFKVLNKPVGAAAGAGRGGMIANFNIHLHGSATKADGVLVAAEIKKQFNLLMKQYGNQQARISFLA